MTRYVTEQLSFRWVAIMTAVLSLSVISTSPAQTFGQRYLVAFKSDKVTSCSQENLSQLISKVHSVRPLKSFGQCGLVIEFDDPRWLTVLEELPEIEYIEPDSIATYQSSE